RFCDVSDEDQTRDLWERLCSAAAEGGNDGSDPEVVAIARARRYAREAFAGPRIRAAHGKNLHGLPANAAHLSASAVGCAVRERNDSLQFFPMKQARQGVHFSSQSDEWPTPQWLFDSLSKEFLFTLDP